MHHQKRKPMGRDKYKAHFYKWPNVKNVLKAFKSYPVHYFADLETLTCFVSILLSAKVGTVMEFT